MSLPPPPRRAMSRPQRPFRPPPRLMYLAGPKTFAQLVVGASHYQTAIRQVVDGLSDGEGPWPVRARLVHESNNPADWQAVRVDIGEVKVGYLSREDARRFRKHLQRMRYAGATVECDGVIVAGKRTWANYGVRLDLPPY
jgi:hypothetical protein